MLVQLVVVVSLRHQTGLTNRKCVMAKDKKNQKDTNKQGGKSEKQEKPLTREAFHKFLQKISRPKDAKSSEEKSKTSE